MNKSILTICFFLSTFSFCYSQCEELDLKKYRLIGVEESTHGTKEFQLNHLQLIDQLSKTTHDITIYLEANYADCFLLNLKIQNGLLDSSDICNLHSWPFRTKETYQICAKLDSLTKLGFNANLVGIDFQGSSK